MLNFRQVEQDNREAMLKMGAGLSKNCESRRANVSQRHLRQKAVFPKHLKTPCKC